MLILSCDLYIILEKVFIHNHIYAFTTYIYVIYIYYIISCDLYTFYKKVFKKLKVLFYNLNLYCNILYNCMKILYNVLKIVILFRSKFKII